MDFPERLKKCRKTVGMNQADLAEAIGVTQKDVSRWESGIYTPRLDYVVKICIALNVSADTLLGLNDE